MKFDTTVRMTVFMMGALVCLAASGREARKVDPRDHSHAQGIAGATRAKPVELPKGAGEDWWTRVKGNIEAEEYEAVWTDDAGLPGVRGAWRVQNRANGFEACFTGAGVRVARRLEECPSWEWGLELVRWGREGSLWEASPGKTRAVGNRVDLDRGPVQEWYINDERGLEQGFTIAAPPMRRVEPSGEAGRVDPSCEASSVHQVEDVQDWWLKGGHLEASSVHKMADGQDSRLEGGHRFAESTLL